MAIKISTGLREGLAVSDSLRGLLTGAKLRIYGGTVPETADAALGSATLLSIVSADGDGVTFEVAAPGGSLLKTSAEVWSAAANEASGDATFFRLQFDSDAGGSSSSAVRVQGSAGVQGTDLELPSVALVEGAPLTINSAAFTIPASL